MKLKSCKRARFWMKQNNKIKEEHLGPDHLSALPDAILITVLSLLPLRIAVSTSILSKRWALLWTHLTSITIHARLFDHTSTETHLTSVLGFLDRLTSRDIHTLNVRLKRESTPCRSSIMEGLINYVYDRNVKEFETGDGYTSCVGEEFVQPSISLPRKLFECMALQSLKLGEGLRLEYDKFNAVDINLPKLKELEIFLYDKCCGIMGALTKSSPVLEKLKVHGWFVKGPVVIDVVSESLRELQFESKGELMEVVKVTIRAPKLEKLVAIDWKYVEYSLLEDAGALVDVKILSIGHHNEKIWLKLVQGLCSVRNLDLRAEVFAGLAGLSDDRLSIYHNLVCLKTSVDGNENWKFLLRFLQCCPILEVLVITAGTSKIKIDSEGTEEYVPPCLINMVKRVEIHGDEGVEEDLDIPKYMLRNAKVLQSLYLHFWMSFKITKDQLREVFELLCQDPRSSEYCEIKCCTDNFAMSNKTNKMERLGVIQQRNYSNEKAEDRFSKLPDSVLVKILSLLPAKQAVSSGIFSKRWRHLWSKITSIHLTSHFSIPDDFFTAVNNILQRLTSEEIQIFEVELPHTLFFGDVYEDHYESYNSQIMSWIALLCTRLVQEIKLSVQWHDLDPLLILPHQIFECLSLEKLALKEGFNLFSPDHGISNVNLPNLKQLDIFLHDSSCAMIGMVIKSCPLLERLCIEGRFYAGPHCISIFGTNLKELRIHSKGDYHIKHRVVINAPSLLNFKIGDSTLLEYSFESPPLALIEGEISIFNRCGRHSLQLFHALSSVRHLDISASTLASLYSFDNMELPVFPNLVRLVTSLQGSKCWKCLMRFLQCSPNLEALIVGMGYSKVTIDREEEEFVPSCLSSAVEMIEIKGGHGVDHELVIPKYMLRNAKALKCLSVQVWSLKMTNIQFLEFFRELYTFPRTSFTCNIKCSSDYQSVSTQEINLEELDSLILQCK